MTEHRCEDLPKNIKISIPIWVNNKRWFLFKAKGDDWMIDLDGIKYCCWCGVKLQ